MPPKDRMTKHQTERYVDINVIKQNSNYRQESTSKRTLNQETKCGRNLSIIEILVTPSQYIMSPTQNTDNIAYIK